MKMPGTNHQGGVAVGVLRNVDVWEAELIISLRLWCSGLSGRADVYEAFSSRFSSERAAQAENIALLAAQVGQTVKQMSLTRTHVHARSPRTSAQLH